MAPLSAEADAVARRLFPDEIAGGSDCRAEVGREGEPCNICASTNEQWARRVEEVRLVLWDVFA